MKSDSASDITSIANDSDSDSDDDNNNPILNQEDYSFITGGSDITLAQDDVPITPEMSLPSTPNLLSPSLSKTTTSMTTTKEGNNRPLPALPLPGADEQTIHHVVVSEKPTHTVKLHILKSRFKQALGLSPHHHKHRYRRNYVDVEHHHEPHPTKKSDKVIIERNKNDNNNENGNNQCAERYRESMELPAPTCHLKHYHPEAPIPTLSYSVCGPGRYKPLPYHPKQDKQLQEQCKRLPARPTSSIPPVPPPKKMPVKGILKKRPISPSPEQEQQQNIESTPSTPEPSSSTASSSTIVAPSISFSASSSLSSTSTATLTIEKQHNQHAGEEKSEFSLNGTNKYRFWLHKLKRTVTPSNQLSTQQQNNNNNNNNNKNNNGGQRGGERRKRTIRYNKMVIVHETYTRQEYNRSPDPNASCSYLSAEEAQDIKDELNMFKFNEMSVHPNSRIYTHFFI